MNKKIKELLARNEKALLESNRSLEAIFNIIFSNPDHVLCEENDGFRIKKYTYGEMRDRIVSAAAGLYEKIGNKGEYVALEMENCSEWIVAFWAILMSGNKPYLVNMRYPSSLSNGILKRLSIKFSICTKPSALEVQTILISDIEGSKGDLPKGCFANELAFSSSATSMNEVICFYTGYQICEQILNFKSIVKENPRITKHYKGNLKQLAFLPFYHVFGLFAVYFWFTFFSTTLVFLRNYSADTILKTCKKHQVTHIFAVPMLWHSVEQQLWATVNEQGVKKVEKFKKALKFTTALQNLFPSFAPEIAKVILSEVTDKLFGRSVVFCINGGSYLRDSAIELFNGLGYSMHNGYGMSEIGITSVELRSKPKHLNQNSIGRPFDSVEYRIGEDGILQVRGSSLCVKKLINGKDTMADGWFNTGDIMEEQNGNYFIKGRLGDVVIGENGENINPDSIEKFFIIKDAAALSVLGLEGGSGEELSIVVQINPYASEKTVESIKNEVYGINNTFSHTTAIKKFYFTSDDLAPPTAVKVSRSQLKNKIASGEVKLTAFADMTVKSGSDVTSPLLAKVKEIIAEVLEIPTEKIDGNSHVFFDLGATSIQYFSVLTRLSEVFGISDYDKNDKYCYTPKDICEYIERRL